MFRIKICGITDIDDARLAVDAGADAIGLNFYPGSPRCVAVDRARDIVAAVEGRCLAVGVFVNESPDHMVGIAKQAGLGALQLHGDEPPEIVGQLPDWPLIRARRMGNEGVGPIVADLQACAAAGRAPDAVLIDAPAPPGQYGGTGHTVAWTLLADGREGLGETPLILAGGLRPGNVAAAIHAVQPAGVDVASGVESQPGRKEPELVREFVAEIRSTGLLDA